MDMNGMHRTAVETDGHFCEIQQPNPKLEHVSTPWASLSHQRNPMINYSRE